MLEEKEHRKVNLAAERMEKKKAREEKTAQKKNSTAAMQRGRQVAGHTGPNTLIAEKHQQKEGITTPITRTSQRLRNKGLEAT